MQTQPQQTEHLATTSLDDTRLLGVLSHAVDEVWEEVAPLLKQAIDRSVDGKFDVDYVYNAIIQKDMQLWLFFSNDGICGVEVTQIINFPNKKVLMLALTAGKHSERWLHHIEGFKQFAKEHGCSSIEGYGRPGWEKLLVPLGFDKIHTVFRLTL